MQKAVSNGEYFWTFEIPSEGRFMLPMETEI